MNQTKAIINQAEVALMAKALKSQHLRFCLLWELGCLTGLRVSDLLTLKTSHFMPGGSFKITERKTGNTREIKLHTDVMVDVNFYIKLYKLRPNDYLFYGHSSNKQKPMSRQWVHRIIARTATKRGLNFIGAHSMRKIYACELFRTTGQINAVQAVLGHKHFSTTLIYLKDLLESI